MYINELWIKAMNKLKEDKSMFSSEDLVIYLNFYNNYKSMVNDGILSQIDEDMRVYKKYDAIVMWLGDGGLVEHEPEFIKGLVKVFGVE